MAYLLIDDRFHAAPEVAAIGNRALGLWIRLASYHARWHTYDIPFSVAKMCGGRALDIRTLIEHGWLVEANDGWQLGLSDTGLWKIASSVDARPSRPPIPAALRAAVFERDGRICPICDATDDLTLDHIIPWSHGGPDTYDNLRVLCRRCNSIRGNRVEVET